MLDVATGTGLVAAELLHRGFRVTGLDQSPEMLAVARRRLGSRAELVEASAETMPLADASFDHLTFTYLLRYVDDPGATLAELARVVRTGGVVASLEFGIPGGLARPLWELYVRVGLPLAGRALQKGLERGRPLPRRVDSRLLEPVSAGAPARALERGGPAPPQRPPPESRRRRRDLGNESVRPSWYALDQGGWRDYVTLLHLPYTAWHVSYVVIGGCLVPAMAWGRLGAAVAAFALAVGVGAHALDELRGRPLETRIPDAVLVALAVLSIGAACAIGIVGAITFRPWLVALVPIGLFLVVAYNLELFGGRFHSDLWFGLAWGGFPVVAGYAAVAGELQVAAAFGAAFAVLLSLAQRVLSNRVRFVRRRVTAVHGELELADGSREALSEARLIATEELGLRLLAAATVVLAAAFVAFRV